LADAHAAEWIGLFDELTDLIPVIVMRELLEDGLACRCLLPCMWDWRLLVHAHQHQHYACVLAATWLGSG
jgi:hypothetical protein